MKSSINLAFILALFSLAASAADKLTENTLRLSAGEKSAPAKITDMAWYAGRWTGTGFGGENEETWMPPNGGMMLGMYRLVQNGRPSFFELLEIYEVDNTIALRLKHFNPDLTGWEEKDKFVSMPFVK